ncbi:MULTISPECIES: hypothetical protein [unclassified Microcoleus]|uniref:hypothetical protein n=1 Tax=unclassified Microcoleus TaxID=2642155 RepID=UPI002FD14CD4
MDAIVDWTTVIPGYRPIAHLYTDSRSAIDPFVRVKHRQPAAKILKPTSWWRRISGTRCCHNRIKLH